MKEYERKMKNHYDFIKYNALVFGVLSPVIVSLYSPLKGFNKDR